MEINLEELRGKTNEKTKVLEKVPKKAKIHLPNDEKPLFEYEMYKKDILTKNKKTFFFYNDKCLFCKVNFKISLKR